MDNGKKKITGTDISIICCILGIIACIVLIVDSFISGTSKTLPIILLCTLSANLCANLKVKKITRNKIQFNGASNSNLSNR